MIKSGVVDQMSRGFLSKDQFLIHCYGCRLWILGHFHDILVKTLTAKIKVSGGQFHLKLKFYYETPYIISRSTLFGSKTVHNAF
jgi:hypothetical protein